MYRKTFVEINLDNIHDNVKQIISKYNNYKYYIGMVKGNAYGHGMYIVNTLIDAGINYLAVSSLDEAIEIRKYNKDIPILCTEIIDLDNIDDAISNSITLTIDELEYLKEIKDKKVKIHIKLNTGMNRLGVDSKDDFNELYNYIKSHENIDLEGIYTHFATPGINDPYFDKQVEKFKEITKDIDLSSIPIIHLSSSFILLAHPKIDFANAIRVGTILYGYDVSLSDYGNDIKAKIKKVRDNYLIKKDNISPVIRNVHIDLKPALKLKTNVMKIRDVKKGELLGYGHYNVEHDSRIAILPIGYQDGIGVNTENRIVIINDNKYKTVGQMEMCMMFVEIDDKVKVGDQVTLLGDGITLGMFSRVNNLGIQQALVNIGKDLPRKYIKDGKEVVI